MKLIKQTTFKVEIAKGALCDHFFVEAGNLEEALSIARGVLKTHYSDYTISTIGVYAPVFKSVSKTITVEL